MRKYRLRVGLDVDDVLYVCNEYALGILRERHGDLPELNINKINSWGAQGNVLDERFAMFSSPEFVASQPLFPGAQKFVRELSKIADVFFVTAVPPACMSARAERLAHDFPEVPTSNIVIGTRKDIMDLDILLDDAAHNISRSRATYPVLLRRPWNTHLSGLLSVNTYDDFIHLAKLVRNSFVEKAPDLSKGGVLCLVGASGTGKTQIASLLTADERFAKPKTTTTRAKRPSEPAGAYRFVSEEEFLRERDAGAFIETTVYSGCYYGTSDAEIAPIVESGRIAVIPIDICGAISMKNLYRSRAMLVFTDRSREGILYDILSRDVPDDDKVRRIMSLEFESRNEELCDLAVRFDDGAAAAAAAIRREIGL
ncbi:MAG: hypothetical protein MJ088_01785 [Clostridia bacterium]|nr:hypothetical protein [Clostridia bacterium]